MWIADGWNDYEVIDCSEGEKLRIGSQEWQRALQSGSQSVFSCLWEQPPLEFCEVDGLEAHLGTTVAAKYLCLEVKADQCARALR